MTRSAKTQEEKKLDEVISEKLLTKFDDKWMDSLVSQILIRVDEKIKTLFSKYDVMGKEMEKNMANITEQMEEIRDKLDNMEQYSRRNSIRIIGLHEKHDEDIREEILSIFKVKMGINLCKNEIDCCFRIGAKSDKTRPVLVKFVTNKGKNEVYYRKKQLKGTNIIIREDLTKERNQVVKSAVETLGAKKVWTKNGLIYVLVKNNIKQVSNMKKLLDALKDISP